MLRFDDVHFVVHFSASIRSLHVTPLNRQFAPYTFRLKIFCPLTYLTFPAYSVKTQPPWAKRLAAKRSRGELTKGRNVHKSSILPSNCNNETV